MASKSKLTTDHRILSVYVSKYQRGFVDAVEKFAEETGDSLSGLIIEALKYYFFSDSFLTTTESELFTKICDAVAEAQGDREVIEEIYREVRRRQRR